MGGGSPYVEFLDPVLFSRDVLESDACDLVLWSDLVSGVEYLSLVFVSGDEYTAGTYTVYEYDLERFRLAALLLDRVEGVTVLGWCWMRRSIVRYYTGKCRYYAPVEITSRKITHYLKHGETK